MQKVGTYWEARFFGPLEDEPRTFGSYRSKADAQHAIALAVARHIKDHPGSCRLKYVDDGDFCKVDVFTRYIYNPRGHVDEFSCLEIPVYGWEG